MAKDTKNETNEQAADKPASWRDGLGKEEIATREKAAKSLDINPAHIFAVSANGRRVVTVDGRKLEVSHES